MLDFNIHIKSSNSDKDKLENLCNLLNAKTLVHSESCFITSSKPIIDLFLTNKLLHFQKPHLVKMVLSHYHKRITFFFKACSSKLRKKVIYHRSYKKSNEPDHLCSLNKSNFVFWQKALSRTTTF